MECSRILNALLYRRMLTPTAVPTLCQCPPHLFIIFTSNVSFSSWTSCTKSRYVVYCNCALMSGPLDYVRFMRRRADVPVSPSGISPFRWSFGHRHPCKAVESVMLLVLLRAAFCCSITAQYTRKPLEDSRTPITTRETTSSSLHDYRTLSNSVADVNVALGISQPDS